MFSVYYLTMCYTHSTSFFFFFNDTATTEIYTLSLHDALPISWSSGRTRFRPGPVEPTVGNPGPGRNRSEEHTSELQSLAYLVCRLLLEKKKKKKKKKCICFISINQVYNFIPT